MRTVETGVDITAPRWRVWQVLTDVDRYPAWNPFVTSVDGALRGGRQASGAPGHGKAPTEYGSLPSAAASAGGRPSGHDRHALAEAAVSRYKRVIGDAPRSRTDRRATEVVVRALNRVPGFGRPESARDAWTPTGIEVNASAPLIRAPRPSRAPAAT